MAKKGAKPVALSQEYIVDSDAENPPKAASSPAARKNGSSEGTPQKVSSKKKRTLLDQPSRPAPLAKGVSPVTSSDAPTDHSPLSPNRNSRSVETGNRTNSEGPGDSQQTAPGSRPHSTFTRTPTKQFKPPLGFEELVPDSSSAVPNPVNALSNKRDQREIWHITAPASIPLSSIKEMNVDAAMSGDSVLEYNHTQYGFFSGDNLCNHVLLPKIGSSKYRGAQSTLSKSRHLRRIPDHQLDASSRSTQADGATRFVATAQPAPRQPPKQREMLRMRYKPFGIDDDGMKFLQDTSKSAVSERCKPQYQSQISPPMPTSTPKRTKKNQKQFESTEKRGETGHSARSQILPVQKEVATVNTATPRKKTKKRRTMHEDEL